MTRSEEMAVALEAAEAEEDREGADEIYVRPKMAREPSQVYSVRIPVARIEELRRVAERECVGPTTLMRTWVIDRLDAESLVRNGGHDIVVGVTVTAERIRDELRRPERRVLGVSA